MCLWNDGEEEGCEVRSDFEDPPPLLAETSSSEEGDPDDFVFSVNEHEESAMAIMAIEVMTRSFLFIGDSLSFPAKPGNSSR